jgi:lipid-A-disaccharide synthase-like uncharacterized protein
MFESLDEQMKHDDAETSTPKERMLKWILIGLVATVVFGGLFMGIRLLG